MKAVDFAKLCLEMSSGWVMGLIEDMKDAPLTAPTPNGGNHPLWCLGHLIWGGRESDATTGPREREPRRPVDRAFRAWKPAFLQCRGATLRSMIF